MYMLCPYRAPEVVVSCILFQTIHFIMYMNTTSSKAAYFTIQYFGTYGTWH